MEHTTKFAGAEADRLTADLHALAQFTDPSMPGWTRRALGEPYRESRGWVTELMRAAGLEVSRDKAGNILGRLPGYSNVYVATGHGPSGLQLGPYSGALVARLAQGIPPDVDITPFLPERFSGDGFPRG